MSKISVIRLLAALVIPATISGVVISTSSAQTIPAPELNQQAAQCFRSLVQADDLFCLNRYELPTHINDEPEASEAWCQVLVDQTGCTADPVLPTAPWTLQIGSAFVALYNDDVLLGQAQVPRIGQSLAGLYFEAGHGITWGDSDVMNCVESSPTQFTSTTSSCLSVFWNSEANTAAAQRSALSDALVQHFLVLEGQNPLIQSGTFVQGNLLTNAARTIAVETLNIIDYILSDTFQTQATPFLEEGYSTPTSNLALQNEINATATAFRGDLDAAGSALGTSGDAAGLILMAAIGLVAFVVTVKATDGNLPLGAVAFLTAMLAGIPLGAVPVAVGAVTAVIVGGIGGVFILKKFAL